jgi:hypothetical protein
MDLLISVERALVLDLRPILEWSVGYVRLDNLILLLRSGFG